MQRGGGRRRGRGSHHRGRRELAAGVTPPAVPRPRFPMDEPPEELHHWSASSTSGLELVLPRAIQGQSPSKLAAGSWRSGGGAASGSSRRGGGWRRSRPWPSAIPFLHGHDPHELQIGGGHGAAELHGGTRELARRQPPAGVALEDLLVSPQDGPTP
jgi:hypothetical protein